MSLDKVITLAKVTSLALAGTFTLVVAAELVNGAVRPAPPSSSAIAGPIQPPPGLKSPAIGGRSSLVTAPSSPALTPVATAIAVRAPQGPAAIYPRGPAGVYPSATPAWVAPNLATRSHAVPSVVPPVAPTSRPLLSPPTLPLAFVGAKVLSTKCMWPLVGFEPMQMTVKVTVPAPIGGTYPSSPVVVAGQLSASTIDGLNTIQAASLGGSLTLIMALVSPDGSVAIRRKLALVSMTVPPAGEATFVATGTLPSLSFQHAGEVTITATSALFSPVATQSTGVAVPADQLDLSSHECTFDPGQDLTIAQFPVIAP